MVPLFPTASVRVSPLETTLSYTYDLQNKIRLCDFATLLWPAVHTRGSTLGDFMPPRLASTSPPPRRPHHTPPPPPLLPPRLVRRCLQFDPLTTVSLSSTTLPWTPQPSPSSPSTTPRRDCPPDVSSHVRCAAWVGEPLSNDCRSRYYTYQRRI